MKSYKFNFMKGCGYRSENYILSLYIDGSVLLSDTKSLIALGGDISNFLFEEYFLSSLQNNVVSKTNKETQNSFYKRIFESIRNKR